MGRRMSGKADDAQGGDKGKQGAVGDGRMPVELVETTRALEELCQHMAEQPAVGLDTEFVRSRTFFPTLGLIQAAVNGTAYLIDPLAVDSLEPFKVILADRGVAKVFHSCGEDLEVLYYLCGFVPGPVFDTQIAASLVGFGMQPSLQYLAQELLDVQLGKGETRSNWIKRPLTTAQVDYAARDVLCLPGLHRHLKTELESRERVDWAAEEFGRLEDVTRFELNPDRAYLRFSSLWQYTSRQLAALQGVCALREREAMQRDLPRGFVLSDKVVRAIVLADPRSLKELAGIEGLKPGQIRRNGKALLAILDMVRDLPQEQLPNAPIRPKHSRRAARGLECLRKSIEQLAGDQDVPPEMLGRKKALRDVVRRYLEGQSTLLPPEMRGWRGRLTEATLRETLESCLGPQNT